MTEIHLWHQSSEKPKGKILYEDEDGDVCTGMYRASEDRFDSTDECFWSGSWERVSPHIKRWAYVEEILKLK